MSGAQLPERIAQALAGLPTRCVPTGDGLPTLEVEREAARGVLEALRRAGFEQSTLVTAVDHHPHAPRFEVVWQLRSYAHGERVRVKCRVSGDDARVPSCCDLWPGSNWSERECFDMFGIVFDGHPDLRRLLMPEGYQHHPLRKEFPHQGIEPDRLYREWDRARRERWLAEQQEAGA